MIKLNHSNPAGGAQKKVWAEPTLVIISSDTITKGVHATHEASKAPTHQTPGGSFFSVGGNPISSLPHYHS